MYIKLKKIIPLFLLPLMLLFSPLSVHADSKEYRVDSADFDAVIDSDGSAVITERWKVTFIKGNFTRFYKDICHPLNQLEYFDSVNILDCTINGTNAQSTESDDRIDYHYRYEMYPSSNEDTINWYYSASNETVEYMVRYEILNFVKLNEYDQAEFCYRFIGANFEDRIGQINVKIEFPSGTIVNSYTTSSESTEFNNNVITDQVFNSKGILKYTVSMEPDSFNSLNRVISVIVPEEVSRSRNSGGQQDMSALVFFIFIVIIVFAVIFSSIVKGLKYKAKLKRDPDFMLHIAQRIDHYNIPFIWYKYLRKSYINLDFYIDTIFIQLFDMASKGKVSVIKEGFCISYLNSNRNPEVDKFDNEFLSILNHCMPFQKINNMDVLTIDQITNCMYNPQMRKALSGYITKWAVNYHKMMPSFSYYRSLKENGDLKAIQSDIDTFAKYSQLSNDKTNIYECI